MHWELRHQKADLGVSNDNPYAESLFKTLKYVPNFQPQGFATLTEARLWAARICGMVQ